LKTQHHTRLIYLCSPLRATATRSMEQHLVDAERYELQILDAGRLAVAPHLILTRHLDDTDLRQRARGIDLALKYLQACDELWAFGPRISEGMKGEIILAALTGKPVRWFPSGSTEGGGIGLGTKELYRLMGGSIDVIFDQMRDLAKVSLA
jgi:hypothetical protein